MQIVTSSEFRSNQKKFLELAIQEPVLIKRGDYILELKLKEEETINDTWFENKQNITMLEEGIAEARDGKTISLSEKEIKKMLGL